MLFDEPTPQEELDELKDRDRLGMVLVEDLVPVWMVVFGSTVFTEDQISRLRELTDQSLKIYWGPDSWVEVNLTEGMVYYKHKDGRELSRFIAF